MHFYLLEGLKAGPIAISRLAASIPELDRDRPLSADRFTPREVVAHLADWEPIMRDRVRAAAESPGSTIAAYDEGQMALDNKYSETDMEEQARILREERAKTVAYVQTLSPEQLGHTVIHPQRGVQTGEDLVAMLLGHDMYHVEQLTAYLMKD